MSILIDKRHAGSSRRASPARPASSTPACAATTRTDASASSPASTRRRRARISKASRSSRRVKEAAKSDRRDGERDLRAAGRRGGGDLGGGRGRARPRDLHHRRHPGARHARGAQPHAEARGGGRQEDAAARPQLPGPDHARRDQDRHHAGPHPPEGPDRRRQPLRHAHLRGGRAAHRGRPRPVERGRHRRRPDQRPEAHRRDEALQRRPGHRRRRHDRRDRRLRRGRRGALVQGPT